LTDVHYPQTGTNASPTAARANEKAEQNSWRTRSLYQDRAREIAETANIAKPNKAALSDLIGTVLASLRNHKGKGVQRANEGTPARWRLKEAAN
jgi:hypothetical protein